MLQSLRHLLRRAWRVLRRRRPAVLGTEREAVEGEAWKYRQGPAGGGGGEGGPFGR
jgi:hypothetical protein